MDLFIDMGGTNFRYQLDQNEIISYKTKDIELLGFLDKMINSHPIKRIGISFAGQVNKGKILSSPNININNTDIQKLIAEKYQIDLKLENDLNCAALYESSKYKEYKTAVVLYLGTGFGGALIDGGKLVYGKNNLAGEIGHIPFQTTPFKCGCGRNDCLELTTSGNALKLWSEHFNLQTKDITLSNLQTQKRLEIYDNFISGLNYAVLTLTTLLDPDIFIFGGSVMKNNPQLINTLKKEFDKTPFYTIRQSPQMVLSETNNGSLEGTKLLFGD